MFGTDQIDDIVDQAIALNRTPNCNVYIGAALRKPGTPPVGRAGDDAFLALPAAYVDLDDDTAAEQVPLLYAGHKPTLAVVTGVTPFVRAQLWWRLSEPITAPDRHRALITGMATILHGDPTVANPSRVMRLAGTIAWPVKPGRALELTGVSPILKPDLLAYTPEHLERVFNAQANDAAKDTVTDTPDRGGSLGLGQIRDGREAYMRDTVMACFIEFVGENERVPTAQELYDLAWPQYEANTDLSRPGRGTKEMMAKCKATVARFAKGKLPGLKSIAEVIATWRAKKAAHDRAADDPGPAAEKPPAIDFTPFVWRDPAKLPRRRWLYGVHLIRKFVSVTVAPGGMGKSSLTIAEGLALATGRPLFGETVHEHCTVAIWNGEDPFDELNRRVAAACIQHRIDPAAIAGRFFLNSGRDMPMIIIRKIRER